jgi:orotidine-5'-phosphate decarboxylase
MSRISTKPIPPRDHLIFALDVPDYDRAAALVDALGDAVGFYKVGLELILSRDLTRVVDLLHERGKQIFVDGKLYDVPQTVEAAVRQLTRLGARYTTVHGTGPLLDAACRVRDEAGGGLRILAVTVLTSLDKKDLIELGYGPDVEVERLVVERAGHALRAGCDGVIASGREAPALRAAHGDDFLIVSPGIRPVDRDDDQKRVVTPEMALRGGADHIVVGRPIRDAPDPRAAAEAIQATIRSLFADGEA